MKCPWRWCDHSLAGSAHPNRLTGILQHALRLAIVLELSFFLFRLVRRCFGRSSLPCLWDGLSSSLAIFGLLFSPLPLLLATICERINGDSLSLSFTP